MPDTLYENNTTQSAEFSIGQTGWFAQGFTPSITHDITSVDVMVYRSFTPGIVLVEIYGDNGSNEPDIGSGTLAAGSFDADLIGDSSPGTEENILVSGAGSELTASTKYWLLLRLQNEGQSSQRLCRWRKSPSGDVYGSGNIVYTFDGGSNWTQRADEDFWFKEYGTLPFITLTLDADVNLKKDNVLLTLVSDVSIKKGNITVTLASDVNTVRHLTVSSDVSLKKADVTITISSDVSATILDRVVTLVAEVHVNNAVTGNTWPPARAAGYQEDELWDDETDSWYAPTHAIGAARSAQAGGRLKQNLVVISNQGNIYFGDA